MKEFCITVNHNGTEFRFTGILSKGIPHIIEIGELQLAAVVFEKLWYISNNTLALGDPTMFLKNRSVCHNIYRALRVRMKRKQAKQSVAEILKAYTLNPKTKVKYLSNDEILTLALARSHFRKPELVIIKCIGGYLDEIEMDFSRWKDSNIILII